MFKLKIMGSKRIIVTTVLLAFWLSIFAQQQDTTFSFSLAEAQEFALKNNTTVKNALLDIKSAKKKVWETTAIGLPQVNGKLAYSYMLELPSTIEQFSQFSSIGSSFGSIYGLIGMLAGTPNGATGMPFNPLVLQKLDSLANASPEDNSSMEFDPDKMKWSASLDITVTQLIFSGAYLVGLQTSRVFKSLSQQAYEKSKQDIAESVGNTYYLVLITRENKAVIDTIYQLIQKNANQLKQMQQQGFVDVVDVDQLTLVANNMKNSSEMMARQVEVVERLLKFQMGLDVNSKIELKDDLPTLISSINYESTLLKEFNIDNNIDYQLMTTQEKLMKLNMKYQKSTFLPDIAAFYQYDHQFNENSFTFTPPQIIGVSMNIPIFGSGMKMAKVSQAKISYLKAINQREQVSQALTMGYKEAQSSLLSARDQYELNKKNLELAKRIYDRTYIKFKEGVSSSMDLTQVQNQYLQAQTTYFGTVMTLISAKNKMEKILSTK